MPVVWTDKKFDQKHLLILKDTSIETMRSEARRRIEYRSHAGGNPNKYEGMAALFQTFAKHEFGPSQAPRNTLLAMPVGAQKAWESQIKNGLGRHLPGAHGNEWEFDLGNVFLIEADPSGTLVESFGARVVVAIDRHGPSFHVVHLARAAPLATLGGRDPFRIRADRSAAHGSSTPLIGGEDLSADMTRLFS